MTGFKIVKKIPARKHEGHPMYNAIRKLIESPDGTTAAFELGTLTRRNCHARAHVAAKERGIRVTTAMRGNELYVTRLGLDV